MPRSTNATRASKRRGRDSRSSVLAKSPTSAIRRTYPKAETSSDEDAVPHRICKSYLKDKPKRKSRLGLNMVDKPTSIESLMINTGVLVRPTARAKMQRSEMLRQALAKDKTLLITLKSKKMEDLIALSKTSADPAQYFFRRLEMDPVLLRQARTLVDLGQIHLASCFSSKKTTKTNIMSLPLEIRLVIWEQMVVDRRHFVFLDSPTGAEQPDLAMTSRQIREEILPIFYSKNTFAFETTEPPDAMDRLLLRSGHSGKRNRMTRCSKWIDLMNEGGHLKYIEHLVFARSTLARAPYSCIETAGRFYISVRIRRRHDTRSEYVIEVHPNARCLLAVGQRCLLTHMMCRFGGKIKDFSSCIHSSNGGMVDPNSLVAKDIRSCLSTLSRVEWV